MEFGGVLWQHLNASGVGRVPGVADPHDVVALRQCVGGSAGCVGRQRGHERVLGGEDFDGRLGDGPMRAGGLHDRDQFPSVAAAREVDRRPDCAADRYDAGKRCDHRLDTRPGQAVEQPARVGPGGPSACSHS